MNGNSTTTFVTSDGRTLTGTLTMGSTYASSAVGIGSNYENITITGAGLVQSDYSFRDFKVEKLNYGYIVHVGCHKFAIETKENLIKELTEYISDPHSKEETWWKTKTI